MSKKERPLFGIIAHLGGSYALKYRAQKNASGGWTTSSLSGYSMATIEKNGCTGMPIIDLSTIDKDRSWKVQSWPIEAAGYEGISLNEYLANYVAIGATLTYL